MLNHSGGTPGLLAHDKVRHTARRPDHLRLQPPKVLGDPLFLQRGAKTHQHDIRPSGIDARHNPIVLGTAMIIEAVVCACNLWPGILPAELVGGPGSDPWPPAQKKGAGPAS